MSKEKNHRTNPKQHIDKDPQERLETEITDEQQETPEKEVATSPLEELQRQYDELQDRFLRVSAEYENFRRRTAKEKNDLMAYGNEKTLAALLPVVDDLELALENIKIATDVEALREGIELIIQKFFDYLKKQGVEAIDVLNKPFDMSSQQAIAMIKTDLPEEKGMVLDCTKKGYMLHEKVLRYADVVIGE